MPTTDNTVTLFIWTSIQICRSHQAYEG